MKCMIIDDEPLAIEVLKSHVNKVDGLELVGTYSNPMEAFAEMQKKEVQLLFLDIQMPKITGIEFLKSLQNPPKVIFTTAYRDYALQGYELDIVDYLIKPIPFERFLKSVSKVFRLQNQPKTDNEMQLLNQPFIYVKSDKSMLRILLDDIIYLESLKNYVKIKTTKEEVITHNTITHMEESLPANYFLRIHRSFIISINKIERYNQSMVVVGGKEIPIGRLYKDDVIKELTKNII